jgi:hypothetical protein
VLLIIPVESEGLIKTSYVTASEFVISGKLIANAPNKDLTMLEVRAGFVVGATPSLIAPDAFNVAVPEVWFVLNAPEDPPYLVVTLIRYVVFAVNPPKAVFVDFVFIVCSGEAKFVSELDVIWTL